MPTISIRAIHCSERRRDATRDDISDDFFHLLFFLYERNFVNTFMHCLPRQLFLCLVFTGSKVVFGGEHNPERCSESFCDQPSGDDRDSSVNERDKESLVEIAISPS